MSSLATPLPDENLVRRLLASDKPEDGASLQRLLENPPPQTPNAITSLLVYIAKDAQHGRKLLVSGLLRAARTYLFWLGGCYTLFAWCIESAIPDDGFLILFLIAAVLLVGLVLAAAEAVYHARRSNRAPLRAALLLARRNDPRVIGILARLWTPSPLGPRERDQNHVVARELTRLLSEGGGARYEPGVEAALHQLVARAFPGGWGRRLWGAVRPLPDLTEVDTDLLLVVVRHLSHPHPPSAHFSAPVADETALRRIATAPLTGQNYHLLRDTTQVLLRAQTGQGAS